MFAFLLSFLCLTHVNASSNKKKLVLLPKEKTFSPLKSQWYYIHYLSGKDISTIKATLPNVKIDSTSFNGDTLTLYLSPKEVQAINNLPNIKVYAKEKPKARSLARSSRSSENETYLVYAHSSFQASKYSLKQSHTGPYYFVSTNQPEIFESDPSVLSIQKVPKFEIQNRWATGFLQSGDEHEILRDDYFASNRLYNDRGLNGSNVIVTLIDSGLDVDNCLFKDPNYDTPFNTTNYNHRKVVRYDPFVDNIDKFVGHGTHCGGTIAGQVDTLPISLYNGNAPAAKLYVADVGKDGQGNVAIETGYILEIVDQAKELKSPILSCSWGFNGNNLEITAIYDYLSYQNKDMLFVFAAGNYGDHYTVSPPSDSRNVLTVAASIFPKSGCIEDPTEGPIEISSDTETSTDIEMLKAKAENRFELLRSNPISYFHNLEVVRLNETLDYENYSIYKDKVVILPDKHDFYFDDMVGYLELNEAKAVIHYEDFYLNFQFSIMVIGITKEDDDFFNRHSKININLNNDNCPDGQPEVVSFSSKGPSFLGRRKPDVMAPGTDVWSAATLLFDDACRFYNVLRTMSGTSMATPAVSGSMALVYQYLKESIHRLPIDSSKPITSALLRAFAAASTTGVSENTESGYGSLNLHSILVYPDLDADRGMRFVSDKIKDNEAHSYFIETDKVGTLTVAIAWIDLPMSPESTLPLFSYFEFSVAGPDGTVHDLKEEYSTMRKIVIQNAPIGRYEIRIHVREVMHTDELIDYSMVVTGPFEHLNFNQNPGELKHSVPNTCLSKCPVNKGFAKCDTQTASCICDSHHTGPNCEFEIQEFTDKHKIRLSLPSRQFWYTRIDYSHYKEKLNGRNINDFAFRFTAICSLPTNMSFGMVRFFMNTDNELPLAIPRYSVEMMEAQPGEERNSVTYTFEIPMDDINERNDTFLTIFNDVITDVTMSLEWELRGTIDPDADSAPTVVIVERVVEKLFENKKIWIIIVAAVSGIAIISLVAAIVLAVLLCKKNCTFDRIDHSQTDQYNAHLVGDRKSVV